MRTNKLFLFSLVAAIAAFGFGCSDILEKDISKSQVRLYAPGDGLRSKLYTINYYWEELPGVTKYRIQILQSDTTFKDTLGLIADTLVSKNQFKKTMAPGSYLWSVLGVNGAYKAIRSSVWKLTVDSVSLDGQDFTINSPSGDTAVNTNSVKITWSELSGAKSYGLTIDTVNGKFTATTTTPSYSLKLDHETVFTVSIVAQNGTAKSNPQERIITYDKTKPRLDTAQTSGSWYPGKLTAANPQIVPDTVVLKWPEAIDNLPVIKNYTITLITSDNNIPANGSPFTSASNSQRVVLNPSTKYQWSVIANDLAGNASESSRLMYFKTK